MAKEKITPSDLYTELASMERIVESLRDKISLMEDNEETKIVKKRKEYNLESTIGNIGEELRKNREGRCWNLFHAARKSGLRYETIQGLENGKGTIKNLLKYCEGLGVSLQINIDNKGKVSAKVFADRI